MVPFAVAVLCQCDVGEIKEVDRIEEIRRVVLRYVTSSHGH